MTSFIAKVIGLLQDTPTPNEGTADKGGFNIKSLPSGMYTVTIKKVGYADQVATFAVATW